MVYAEFGGQTECIMGNSKIENMTFGEATEHLNRRNEALRWSILVRKLKHKVQKPIISSEYSYNCGQQTSPTASVTEQSS